MSPDLTNTLDALHIARVPALWTKASQLEAPNMGVWFSNIVLRSEQLTGWLQHGRPNCFWLTGFFNPQGFLTANRQEVCRRHARENWALDDVVNATDVLRGEKEEVRSLKHGRGPGRGGIDVEGRLDYHHHAQLHGHGQLRQPQQERQLVEVPTRHNERTKRERS